MNIKINPGGFWRQRRVRQQTMILIAAAFLLGCAGNYGRFEYDSEVDRLFKDFEPLAGHHYYFSGPETYPRAIIGIAAGYTLVSRFWKPVDMTPEQLKRWVGWPVRGAFYSHEGYGRYILDDQDRRVGVWYSLRDRHAFATVKMLDATTVQVSTPFENFSSNRRSKFFSDGYDDD